VLHTFTVPPDGIGPTAYGPLILSGGTLYGATQGGGVTNSNTGVIGYGTVFSINTSDNDYAVVYTITNSTMQGANPLAGLTLGGNTLYGTTTTGGTNYNEGTIFALTLPSPPSVNIQLNGGNVILTWNNPSFLL
jgi:hypothetical protein